MEFVSALVTGVLACAVALTLSAPLDSYLWDKWLWPEGVVLFFNTVQNKSSEWGVFPWHWYFSSALPRVRAAVVEICVSTLVSHPLTIPVQALSASLPLVLLGLSGLSRGHLLRAIGVAQHIPNAQSNRTPLLWRFAFPALAFVCLYSYLPHKELRFVLPVMPIFTLCAAVGLQNVLPPPVSIAEASAAHAKKNDDSRSSKTDTSRGRGGLVESLFNTLVW